MGNTPLIHTVALHLSAVPPPWQGDKAAHSKGAPLPLRSSQETAKGSACSPPGMCHGLGPQCCRNGPSCELTRNVASSVLLRMQKAEAGSAGYLETGSPHVFFTFIGALGSVFANC